jgi:hypothetical protein
VLWVLGRGLEPIAEKPTGIDAATVAVDAHGRYIAVASKVGPHALFTRHGRPAGQFETRQPIGHLAFVVEVPLLIGASNFGAIMAIELVPVGSKGRLEAQVLWQQTLLSNVGRLALAGSGQAILASCFTHGVHRFDLDGRIEGAYHPGGSVTHAVPDYLGRTIAVATYEGDLSLLNSVGNLRWQSSLPKPAIALQFDALGRYFFYGLSTGEITRIDLEGANSPMPMAPQQRPARLVTGPLRKPDWIVPIAKTDDQADFAVLTVLDDPPRVGFMTTRNQLRLFTKRGQALGQAPEILGIGRSLRTTPGYVVAATDRQILVYDAHRNGVRRVDLSLVDLTHLVARPETYGLALVQERDRIGRATLEGRWIWKRELRTIVEEIAFDPDERLGVTLENGHLLIFDPEGEFLDVELVRPAEPCLLAGAPEGAPEATSWLALARRAQWIKGIDAQGQTVWECPLPFEAWQIQSLGPVAIVTTPDGQALAIDGAGRIRAESRDGDAQAVYMLGSGNEPLRVTRQGANLVCSDLSGQVAWRSIAEAPLGPISAGRSGVAVMIGRSLAWFDASA